jgi:hypothetical protein
MLVLATFFPIPADDALSGHQETFGNDVKDKFAVVRIVSSILHIRKGKWGFMF